MADCARITLFIAKQGLPFREDIEDVTLNNSPGKFLRLLRQIPSCLSIYICIVPGPKCTYTSPWVQNDIICVIAYDIILAYIVDEIKSSQFFSVIADEVSSHNVEHLSVCLRFVDKDCNISEEFIGLMKLERVRAVDKSNYQFL